MNDQEQLQMIQAIASAIQLAGPDGAVQLLVKQGVPQQLATLMVQQVYTMMQSQGAQKAARGAKLSYLRNLNNICPEGSELLYMLAGNKFCPVCAAKHKVQLDCKGSKIPVKAKGGCSKAMAGIKAEMMKCGGSSKKVKKAQWGDKLLRFISDQAQSFAGKVNQYSKGINNHFLGNDGNAYLVQQTLKEREDAIQRQIELSNLDAMNEQVAKKGPEGGVKDYMQVYHPNFYNKYKKKSGKTSNTSNQQYAPESTNWSARNLNFDKMED